MLANYLPNVLIPKHRIAFTLAHLNVLPFSLLTGKYCADTVVCRIMTVYIIVLLGKLKQLEMCCYIVFLITIFIKIYK